MSATSVRDRASLPAPSTSRAVTMKWICAPIRNTASFCDQASLSILQLIDGSASRVPQIYIGVLLCAAARLLVVHRKFSAFLFWGAQAASLRQLAERIVVGRLPTTADKLHASPEQLTRRHLHRHFRFQ